MLIPLSAIELAEDEVVLEGFQAMFETEQVTVTAVLERTCVCLTADGERRLINKRRLLIEPRELPIRRRRFDRPASTSERGQ